MIKRRGRRGTICIHDATGHAFNDAVPPSRRDGIGSDDGDVVEGDDKRMIDGGSF